MQIWLSFLNDFNGKSILHGNRVFSNFDLQLFTDAAGKLGYGAVLGKEWFFGIWNDWWIQRDIMLKELYPIVLAFEVWGDFLQNKRILIRTDNESLVSVLNKQTSIAPFVMILVRRLVLHCLKLNIVLTARHIPGKENNLADLLSRLQVQKFKKLAPFKPSPFPTPVPPLPLRL